MSPFSRRQFLKASVAVGTVSSFGAFPLHATSRKATDVVTLGKSGMQVTRLAFGTGSNNGMPPRPCSAKRSKASRVTAINS
ncbi:MAG: twin-arginine translocation signal domain-containing protein [Terracidiphilus sp.]